jgi:hypothetical protein
MHARAESRGLLAAHSGNQTRWNESGSTRHRSSARATTEATSGRHIRHTLDGTLLDAPDSQLIEIERDNVGSIATSSEQLSITALKRRSIHFDFVIPRRTYSSFVCTRISMTYSLRGILVQIDVYRTSSLSSTICTLILPLLKSPHVCSASNAFSRGNVWLTSGLRSIIWPARHWRPEGQVSR